MDAQLDYDVVDVFTDTPFTGNALAVVLGAGHLPTGALQALAREFNLSETVFATLASKGAGGEDYAVRIFTPSTELPFAGHPSVGAAWALARRGLVSGTSLRQRCAAGLVTLELGDGSTDPVWLTGTAPRLGADVDPTAWLEGVGLAPADLVGLPALVAGAGLDFGYLVVRPDAVARARPDLRSLGSLQTQHPGLGGVVVVGWQQGAAHVRVFADDIGVVEDPATGSAALGLSVVLVAHGLLAAEGPSAYTVRQGAELGRPSTLHCRVEARAGRAVRCQVGGHVVAVASGRIRVPAQPTG